MRPSLRDGRDAQNTESVTECVNVAVRTYAGVVSHVVDDALQHRGQRHHGVGASAVDGFVWFLKKVKKCCRWTHTWKMD